MILAWRCHAAHKPRTSRLALAHAVPVEMRYARTCYDHMAGELSVQLFEQMLRHKLLTLHGSSLEATPEGASRLAAWRVDVAGQHSRRRRFTCTCPDWSERRQHFGGALGAAPLAMWSSHRWVERTNRPRILRITPAGHQNFNDFLANRLKSNYKDHSV